MNPCAIELIGCGALAEAVYAPVLAPLEGAGKVRVTALVDPNAARRALLAKSFPTAKEYPSVEALPPNPGALAVVASPPGAHAVQAGVLLAAGRHVLCEKPLATSVAEAQLMIAAAMKANRLLAAGMMRRFYPAAQALRENVAAGMLGMPLRVEVAEGGRFSWNAASVKFFDPANGGVLFDLGSHVLDLLCHFFGQPASTLAMTDDLGGTNTNCVLTGQWKAGLQARVRLSWDTPLDTGWRIQTSRGECRWDGSADGALAWRDEGARNWQLVGSLPTAKTLSGQGWAAAFARQFENVLAAMAGTEKLLAPADDVLASLRWMEDAKNQAQLLPQPWLSPEETAGAERLAKS